MTDKAREYTFKIRPDFIKVTNAAGVDSNNWYEDLHISLQNKILRLTATDGHQLVELCSKVTKKVKKTDQTVPSGEHGG